MSHALTHASSSAIRSGTSGGIEQYQIVEILLGSQHYDLKGFFPSEKGASGMAEALPGISASAIASPQQVASQINQEALIRKKKSIFWGALAVIPAALTVAAASFFAGQMTDLQNPAGHLTWRVVEVKNDGVVVLLGPDHGQRLQIPKGARLPDGQRLLAVNPDRQVYSTEQQDVRVRRALGAP